jgi:hypothetical protein
MSVEKIVFALQLAHRQIAELSDPNMSTEQQQQQQQQQQIAMFVIGNIDLICSPEPDEDDKLMPPISTTRVTSTIRNSPVTFRSSTPSSVDENDNDDDDDDWQEDGRGGTVALGRNQPHSHSHSASQASLVATVMNQGKARERTVRFIWTRELELEFEKAVDKIEAETGASFAQSSGEKKFVCLSLRRHSSFVLQAFNRLRR